MVVDFGIVKRLVLRKDAGLVQQLFKKLVALFRVGHVPGLFIELEMFLGQVRDQLVDSDVKF